MPYYQSNTLKHALCSNSFPLSRSEGEVLERICSKLGGGLDKAIVPVDSSVVAIEEPYATRAGELQDMVLRNMDCVNINSEYTTIDSHFSILDYLKTVNNPENNLYFYHSDHLGSSSFITDADGIVSQHLQYLPYGELFAEQRDNTARYYTPYKFSGKEKDEETGYSYFGARYYMSDVSVWLSVDPMADDYPHLSPYNYCENKPIVLIDKYGLSTSPVFDEAGTYLGTDNEGFKGTPLIFSQKDKDKFKQGMDHKEAQKIGKEFSPNLRLGKDALNKIFNKIIEGTIFPNGHVLKSNEFEAHVENMPTANARYNGRNQKTREHDVSLDIGDYEWTVENIRATAVHEIYGHGIKNWGDDSKSHHKCYFSEIDSKYWSGSTERYKNHCVKNMWGYYSKEIRVKPLPKKYDVEYRKNIRR